MAYSSVLTIVALAVRMYSSSYSIATLTWGVRLNKRFSFDLFTFLSLINDLTNRGDLDGLWDAVQSATLMMVNVSDGDLEEFVEEIVVAGEMDDMMSDIEKLLKKDGNEKD